MQISSALAGSQERALGAFDSAKQGRDADDEQIEADLDWGSGDHLVPAPCASWRRAVDSSSFSTAVARLRGLWLIPHIHFRSGRQARQTCDHASERLIKPKKGEGFEMPYSTVLLPLPLMGDESSRETEAKDKTDPLMRARLRNRTTPNGVLWAGPRRESRCHGTFTTVASEMSDFLLQPVQRQCTSRQSRSPDRYGFARPFVTSVGGNPRS
jgi:hypothetical protein